MTGSTTASRKAFQVSAFLAGAMLVWCFLQPHDSTAVFDGSALPQNLGWLLTGLVLAAGVSLSPAATRIPTRYAIAIAGCIAWLLITTIHAGATSNPRIGWNGFWQVISIATCYAIGRNLFSAPRGRAVLISVFLASGISLALHGTYQTLVDFPAMRAHYLADPEKVLEQEDIYAPAGSPRREQLENRLLGSQEPFATYSLANSLAVYLSGALILGLGLLAVSRQQSTSPKNTKPSKSAATHIPLWQIAAAGLVCLIMFMTWFLTKSRTAYVGLAAGLGYWALMTQLKDSSPQLRVRIRWAAVGLIAVFAGCFVWFMRNDQLVLSESLYSLRFRLDYWYGTVCMLWDHGLFGVGLGNFQAYYPAYKLETASETIADPHNWFLDIAATLSIPTAIVITGWLADRFLPKSSSHTTDNTAAVDGERDNSHVTAKSFAWGSGLGGLVIWILALLLGQTGGPATLACWLIGAALAIALWPQTIRLSMGPGLPLKSAAFAMLVCLLASGSWQASGLSMPLVLFLAASHPCQAHTPATGITRWLPLGAAGCLFVGFVFQSWMPTTRAWALTQQMRTAQSTAEQVRLAEEATAADPLDTNLLSLHAQGLVAIATGARPTEFASRAQAANTALEQWLDVDGVNFTHWKAAGDLTLRLASKARQIGQAHEKWLIAAAKYYSVASTRYPSDVGLHVQCAAVLQLSGQTEQAKTHLDEAERLSKQTPHDDKMLNMQQIYLPRSILDGPAAQQINPSSTGQAGAEPTQQWLRILWDTPQTLTKER